jgi:hemolysin activation/secretion protein
VAEGRVSVVLVEGYIRDYRVDGDIGPASEYLQQLLARIEASGH